MEEKSGPREGLQILPRKNTSRGKKISHQENSSEGDRWGEGKIFRGMGGFQKEEDKPNYQKRQP